MDDCFACGNRHSSCICWTVKQAPTHLLKRVLKEREKETASIEIKELCARIVEIRRKNYFDPVDPGIEQFALGEVS